MRNSRSHTEGTYALITAGVLQASRASQATLRKKATAERGAILLGPGKFNGAPSQSNSADARIKTKMHPQDTQSNIFQSNSSRRPGSRVLDIGGGEERVSLEKKVQVERFSRGTYSNSGWEFGRRASPGHLVFGFGDCVVLAPGFGKS